MFKKGDLAEWVYEATYGIRGIKIGDVVKVTGMLGGEITISYNGYGDYVCRAYMIKILEEEN